MNSHIDLLNEKVTKLKYELIDLEQIIILLTSLNLKNKKAAEQ